LRIVTLGIPGDFGWELAHAAVSRRPPIPLDTMVARTEGYANAAKVWDLSIEQGAFSVVPNPNVKLFATFAPLDSIRLLTTSGPTTD
jgi:hypothetical protein